MKVKTLTLFILIFCSSTATNAVLKTHDKTPIRFDGFYYTVNRHDYVDTIFLDGKTHIINDTGRFFIDFLFFYADRKIAFLPKEIKKNTIVNDDYFLNDQKLFEDEFSKECCINWGTFNQSNDTIRATKYARRPDIGHVGIKMEMVALSDNSILLKTETCKWCKDNFTDFNHSPVITHNPALAFRFIPFAVKPDSSLAWFSKRRWFRHGKY